MNPVSQHIPVFPQQVQPAVYSTQPVMMTHQPTVIPTQPASIQPVMMMHQPTVIPTPVAVPPPPYPRQVPQNVFQMPMQPGTYPLMQPNGARQPQMTRLQTPYTHVPAQAQYYIPTQLPRNDVQRNASYNQMSNHHVPSNNKPECDKIENSSVTSPATKNETNATDCVERDVIVIPASPDPRPTDYEAANFENPASEGSDTLNISDPEITSQNKQKTLKDQKPQNSVATSTSESSMNKHFLEFPSRKKTPPDVEQIREVAYSGQDRI